MGTVFGPASKAPSNEDCDDERPSLADVVGGALADVDVDSVEAVREIRRDE